MKKTLMIVLTLVMSGRMMTLAFIARAGGDGPGDPPAAWLMPLIGDAVVGLGGLLVAYLIARRRGLWVWTVALGWNVVAIWDALSAYIISRTNPWPEFFMLKLMGSGMFFTAIAMHLILIYLITTTAARAHFLAANDPMPTP